MTEEWHTWPSDEQIKKIAEERQVGFWDNYHDDYDNYGDKY